MGLATLIAGAIATHRGKKQQKEAKKILGEADQLIPSMEDQEQRAFFNDMERKREGYYSGSFASSQFDDLNSSFSSLKEGAMSLASGGGADVTALLRTQHNVGKAYNSILGNLENRGMQRDTMSSLLLDNISQRKLELQLLKHQEKRYDGTSLMSAGMQNQSAGNAAMAAGADDIVSTVLGVFGMNKGKSKSDIGSALSGISNANTNSSNASKDNANRAKSAQDDSGSGLMSMFEGIMGGDMG